MFRNALRQSTRAVGAISASSRVAAVSPKSFCPALTLTTHTTQCFYLRPRRHETTPIPPDLDLHPSARPQPSSIELHDARAMAHGSSHRHPVCEVFWLGGSCYATAALLPQLALLWVGVAASACSAHTQHTSVTSLFQRLTHVPHHRHDPPLPPFPRYKHEPTPKQRLPRPRSPPFSSSASEVSRRSPTSLRLAASCLSGMSPHQTRLRAVDHIANNLRVCRRRPLSKSGG